ncbi:unnamed protein product, partial [Staurois parvus]
EEEEEALSVSRQAPVKACRRSFHIALGGFRTLDVCLDSVVWPCADHVRSPKKKKKNLSSNIHQTEHVQSDSTRYVLSGDKRGTLEEGDDQRSQDQNRIFTQCRGFNSLGSTVSIKSMLYCIYRL